MLEDYAALTAADLDRLYPEPSVAAIDKVADRLTAAHRRWIERSPFMVIASGGEHGRDCSPRGDHAGRLVRILDEHCLAIPDRRGNRRVDTLRNLIERPIIGLLFLIPGIRETVRVNGRARVTADDGLLESLTVEKARPTAAIIVDIDAVYMHCGSAFMRSGLWDAQSQADRDEVPSAGELIGATSTGFDVTAYDAGLDERKRDSLW